MFYVCKMQLYFEIVLHSRFRSALTTIDGGERLSS